MLKIKRIKLALFSLFAAIPILFMGCFEDETLIPVKPESIAENPVVKDDDSVVVVIEDPDTSGTDSIIPIDPDINPTNKIPVITSFLAEPMAIPMGGRIDITVEAEDPDDDELTISWKAMGGIEEDQGVYFWIAPVGPG